MQEWISQTLASPTLSFAVVAAAFLLGVAGAVTNCCNLPVLAAVAGYSGSLGGSGVRRRHVVTGGLFFMLGTIVALAAIGTVAGFVSQTVGSSLGRYWKLFAGLVMVLLGLTSLGLLPFSLPKLGLARTAAPKDPRGAMLFGFALGGGLTACSAGCNPALFVALGIVTLQGRAAWGAAILGVFAVGYSLPVAAGLIGLGLGFGRLSSAVQRSAPVIKIVAGGLLVGVGFYLLATA